MSGLKKRSDGRYQRRITLSDGTQRLIYAYSLPELNTKERLLRADDSAGLEIGDDTLVGEWARIWFDSYKTDLRPATVRMYRNAYNQHIGPLLGGIELRSIRAVHVRRVMSGVSRLSESSQHKVLITMRQLFATARQNRLMQGDPTEGIKVTPHVRKKAKEFLTPDEAAALMAAVQEPRARAFCALCLYCGLRREEALGLRWSDIGPTSMLISRAVTFPTGNAPDPSMELKTKASHRVLPIPAALRAVLDKTPRTSQYVVPTTTGDVMTSGAYTKMFAYVKAAAPYPIHAHMLRHTYATTLYHAGVDLRTAQQLLGHSTIQMTANIYTHLEQTDSLCAVTLIDGYLSRQSNAEKHA